MIVVMVLSLIIQNRLNSRFEKYSQVPLGLTGAEVALKGDQKAQQEHRKQQ